MFPWFQFTLLLELQVGTVLDRRDAKEAVDLGAKFLMSPAMVKVFIIIWLNCLTWETMSAHRSCARDLKFIQKGKHDYIVVFVTELYSD